MLPRSCFPIIVLAGFMALPAAAVAQEAAPASPKPSLSEALTGSAKDDYESGKLLFADGDYAGAVLKFQSAYDATKDPRLLWNAAAAEKYLRHYVRVESLLERYLAEGGPSTDAERSDAQAVLDTVRGFIGAVTIDGTVPGALVSVDDTPRGTTPLAAPLRVDMGPHRFRVTKDGFKDSLIERQISGREAVTLTVSLVPETHRGRLRVSTEDAATIALDGRPLSRGAWEGELPSGMHHVEVTARERHPYRTDVLVQDDKTSLLQVSLERIERPKQDLTWLWIAGGVLAAGALGVGGYFVLKPEDKGPPPPVLGTLGTAELGLRGAP